MHSLGTLMYMYNNNPFFSLVLIYPSSVLFHFLEQNVGSSIPVTVSSSMPKSDNITNDNTNNSNNKKYHVLVDGEPSSSSSDSSSDSSSSDSSSSEESDGEEAAKGKVDKKDVSKKGI